MTKYTTWIAAALALAPLSIDAGEIRATSGFGPSHVLATSVYPLTFEKLEEFTNGEWTGRDTPGGLLSPKEMNEGLRDGVSEMGAIIMPYFAADYAEAMLPGELSILGTNNLAISSAVTEYIATCDECLAEFAEYGQVFLGNDATPTYNFLSTKPLTSLDDLKGVRIRTAGAVFTRFVEALGAEPVQMPASELFEALNSGVIDATYSSIPELNNAQLYDVVDSVSLIQLGVFNSAAISNVSLTLWARMDADERAALARASQYGQAVGVNSWNESEAKARSIAAERGIEFITPDAAVLDKAKAFNEAHLASVVETLEKRGVTNAAAKVERYKALVEKWHGLIGPETTTDEVAELRWQEIFSKIDYSTYGM